MGVCQLLPKKKNVGCVLAKNGWTQTSDFAWDLLHKKNVSILRPRILGGQFCPYLSDSRSHTKKDQGISFPAFVTQKNPEKSWPQKKTCFSSISQLIQKPRKRNQNHEMPPHIGPATNENAEFFACQGGVDPQQCRLDMEVAINQQLELVRKFHWFHLPTICPDLESSSFRVIRNSRLKKKTNIQAIV